jgi:calcineurin-like phosphoesterase family protein
MRWFTADTHYFHESVIQFGKRPWPNLDEMHEGLIANWNSRVRPKDEVWVIGDFAFRNKKGDGIAAIFHRLNGKKHLIDGNHDNKDVFELPWTWRGPYREMHEEGHNLILSHYPMRSWNKMYRGSYHFYGHEHGNVVNYSHHHNAVGKGGSCDVGSDCFNWHPVSFQEAIERIQTTGVRNPDLWRADGTDRTIRRSEEEDTATECPS